LLDGDLPTRTEFVCIQPSLLGLLARGAVAHIFIGVSLMFWRSSRVIRHAGSLSLRSPLKSTSPALTGSSRQHFSRFWSASTVQKC
jgi:hypothetical protein